MPSLSLSALQTWLPRRWRTPLPIDEKLWRFTLQNLPFLSDLAVTEQERLRQLTGFFLQEKEFHGAHGLHIDDHMALSIAAQACRPLIHMALPSGKAPSHPAQLLIWYDDFVGIVVQPGIALAQRETTDSAGVVHRYREALAGEAMDRGPVMLSWSSVSQAADQIDAGSNVVIHEFVHKLDMRGMHRGEQPDGTPPLYKGFLGATSERDAQRLWQRVMSDAFTRFREAVARSERFRETQPWLDSYAATDAAEFFAVTSEAYFVNRSRFSQELPELIALYDGFFRAASIHDRISDAPAP